MRTEDGLSRLHGRTSFAPPVGPAATVCRIAVAVSNTCPTWWWPTPCVPLASKTTEDDDCRECGSLCDGCAAVPVPCCPLRRRHVFHEAKIFLCMAVFQALQGTSPVWPTTRGDSTLTWSWTTWCPSLSVLNASYSCNIVDNNPTFNGTKLMYMEVGRGLNLRFPRLPQLLSNETGCLAQSFWARDLSQGVLSPFGQRAPLLELRGALPGSLFLRRRPDVSIGARRVPVTWHASVQYETFDFQKELVAYCDSDVDVLKNACLKYRELMLQTVQVDPFSCLTVASVTNKVFKTKFLTETWDVTNHDGQKALATLKDGKWTYPDGWTEDDVASKTFVSSPVAAVPPQGYVTGRQFSKESIIWLEWTARQRGIRIRHALNDLGEKKFGPYWVDGYDADNDEVV